MTKNNEVKFYTNVTVVELVRYSRSYGTRTIEVKYDAAMVENGWLFPIENANGINYYKKSLDAKYIVKFNAKEVSEVVYNKTVKKLQKQHKLRMNAIAEKEAMDKVAKEIDRKSVV